MQIPIDKKLLMWIVLGLSALILVVLFYFSCCELAGPTHDGFLSVKKVVSDIGELYFNVHMEKVKAYQINVSEGERITFLGMGVGVMIFILVLLVRVIILSINRFKKISDEETSSKEHWQDVIFSSVLVLVGGVLLAVLYPQDILIETFSFTAYYILVVLPVFIIYAVLLVLTQPKNKGKGGKGKELKDLELVDKNTDIYDVRNIKL